MFNHSFKVAILGGSWQELQNRQLRMVPGDLNLASSEKLTNQNVLNAKLCLGMFQKDFAILILESTISF